MKIDLTTPALLFSTISLLLLAYTNRFLALASVIRKLHDDHLHTKEQKYVDQISNLRKRIYWIRDMQTLGLASLLSCTVCMAMLFAGWEKIATLTFALSLILMVASLAISIVEIRMSVGALELHLHDMEDSLGTAECEARKVERKPWFRFSVTSMMWASLVAALGILLAKENVAKNQAAEVNFGYGGMRSSSWSIDQILGAPDTKGMGDIPTAWASATPDNQMEWVVAEFSQEVLAKGIEIYETNSPGAVVKVAAVSMTGMETVLWEGTDPLASKGALTNVSRIDFSKPYSTRRIKIWIESRKFPGYNEIDAIELIGVKGEKQWVSHAWSSSSFGTHRPAPSWYWP